MLATSRAAGQSRDANRYQPEGRHQPVDPESPLYRSAIGRLVLVRFTATGPPLAKFKLGQKASSEERRRIQDGLATSAGASQRTLEVLAELGESAR